MLTQPSVGYDAVFVAGGEESVGALSTSGAAVHYLAEAYKHCKPIAADVGADVLLGQAGLVFDGASDEAGVVIAADAAASKSLAARLVAALMQHRFFNREDAFDTPA